MTKAQHRRNIKIVIRCVLEQFKGKKLINDLTDLVMTYYRLGQERKTAGK